MKKTNLIALVAIFISSSALAQAPTTGPNNVFIEQLGSSNTITIEQVGGANNLGGTNSTAGAWDPPGSANYGTVTGSNNVVTATQTGTANLNQYNISGNRNNFTSSITGNTNKSKLSIGNTANPTNLRNTVGETVIGDTNTMVTNIVGSDITSTLAITGGTNVVNADLLSSLGTSTITIGGSSNRLDIQQVDGAGSNGHSLTQNITGDYNSIVTQQQGFNDTTVNINTTGSHNTVTVRTTTGISLSSPMTAVAR